MSGLRFLTENMLDRWFQQAGRRGQETLADLIKRLVERSVPNALECRFQQGESIGQPGSDGELFTNFPYPPFVPDGRSFWELSTELKPQKKATDDYRELTKKVPTNLRKFSSFVFVTPFSGNKAPFTWAEKGMRRWLEVRRKRGEWKDVQIIDGSRLVDWITKYPAVGKWLAEKIHDIPSTAFQTVDDRWQDIQTTGEHALQTFFFLEGKDLFCDALKKIFNGEENRFEVNSKYPGQLADIISAFAVSYTESGKGFSKDHVLIISDSNLWQRFCFLEEPHILVANFTLDEAFAEKHLDAARKSGHSVIFSKISNDFPRTNVLELPEPNRYRFQENLEKCGFPTEQARQLTQKSGGKIHSLLRILRGGTLIPTWGEGSGSNSLAMAMLLGGWEDHQAGDRETVAKLTGKSYETWCDELRPTAFTKDAPLTVFDGRWKVVSRFEGWQVLGKYLSDQVLDRFRALSVEVLGEYDPSLDLPSDNRFAASIYGKVVRHSARLRRGLAESLALLGAHPEALQGCSAGKIKSIVRLVVRELLKDAKWQRWASLNPLLPLIAEASPQEFLEVVESTLLLPNCPFSDVFAQEGSGTFGNNYMTGLLWALETLAWDSEFLVRVMICLGGLASLDPGGQWSNRPINSLYEILVPWYPQTIASVEKRIQAVESLVRENPECGWNLLMKLLPSHHSIAMQTSRPQWRQIIPEDWSGKISNREYWDQTKAYIEMAIKLAKETDKKSAELIPQLPSIPSELREIFLEHLESDKIKDLPEASRSQLWEELLKLVNIHRKHPDAKWSIKEKELERLQKVADGLAPRQPSLKFRRLFGERSTELFEERGNYEEEMILLQEKRKAAISEILAEGGMEAVWAFSREVESPRFVGWALGEVADDVIDAILLPKYLVSQDSSVNSLISSYVQGKFAIRGWSWVDSIDFSSWASPVKGGLFVHLPFVSETWKRVENVLGVDDDQYWKRTPALPYQAKEGLEDAVDKLITFDRFCKAVYCLGWLLQEGKRILPRQAIQALMGMVKNSGAVRQVSNYEITRVIKALQKDCEISEEDLCRIEWAYLALLDGHDEVTPKNLERSLAVNPGFFADIIRVVFRSKKDEPPFSEPTADQKNIARNGYELLHQWRRIPGILDDGSFDEHAFKGWIDEALRLCEESGHLEIALLKIGELLIHSPPSPDGLWIHPAVAEVLNAPNAEAMRDGFRTGEFNSRGVFTFTAGKAERELAEKYRTEAEEVDNRGFFRLAATVHSLAASYQHDAEREEKRELYGER